MSKKSMRESSEKWLQRANSSKTRQKGKWCGNTKEFENDLSKVGENLWWKRLNIPNKVEKFYFEKSKKEGSWKRLPISCDSGARYNQVGYRYRWSQWWNDVARNGGTLKKVVNSKEKDDSVEWKRLSIGRDSIPFAIKFTAVRSICRARDSKTLQS